jgi:hypothetical protein
MLTPRQARCNIPKYLYNLYCKLILIFNQTCRFKTSYSRVLASPHKVLQKETEEKQNSGAFLMPTDDKGESSV